MKIFKRIYDTPLNKDGTEKENEFLGEFEILQVLEEDSYTSKRIGEKDGVKYLIEETEVSGFYHPGKGGSEFEITELTV